MWAVRKGCVISRGAAVAPTSLHLVHTQSPALPKLAALSAAATSFFAAGNVQAATELMQLAESDNRVGIIGLLFLPVLGWVGFNILQVRVVGRV